MVVSAIKEDATAREDQGFALTFGLIPGGNLGVEVWQVVDVTTKLYILCSKAILCREVGRTSVRLLGHCQCVAAAAQWVSSGTAPCLLNAVPSPSL